MNIIWDKVTKFSQIVAIIVFVGVFFLGFYLGQKYEKNLALIDMSLMSKNPTYLVNGEKAEYFGNEAFGDLNGDGLIDKAFLVSQQPGGSGTFYYVMVALKTEGGFILTNPFFVGDRISPQSTYIPKNSRELHVNYAERKPGEPMSTPPSVGAVLLLKVTPEGVLEGLMK
jgi:hypothetical protein